MRRFKEEISRLMYTFYEATGTATIGVDEQLNMVLCYPSKGFFVDFTYVVMNQMTSFLSGLFAGGPTAENQFHTFIIENNIICNVCLVMREGIYCGALITEPTLVSALSPAEIEALLDRYQIPIKDKGPFKYNLLSIKVVPYSRMHALGILLSNLVRSFCDEHPSQQVLHGSSGFKCNAKKPHYTAGNGLLVASRPRFVPYTSYLQVKKGIQSGNTEELSGVMNKIIADYMPAEPCDDTRFLRSMKNSFIKACVMGSFAAVESSTPYVQTMEVADEFIRKIELQDNMGELFTLTKNAMLAFARMVSLGSGSIFSKPVRLVLDYIQEHYPEKVTLERLAEHTGLSGYYLSNIIKRETGLTLIDNINRVRIEKSRQLLLDMNTTVLDVAQQVGFVYQNHFAAVFKKITGVSPSDYRRFMGLEHHAKYYDKSVCSLPPGLIEQAYNMITMSSDFYDVVRIIEPVSRRSWVLQSKDDSLFSETCYNFWGRNEYCANCVAVKAYLENGAAVKISKKGDRRYLVMAIPKVCSEGGVYVIETVKCILDSDYIEAVETASTCAAPNSTPSNDACTGLYSRTYIDRNLPIAMRHHALARQPLSLIIAVIDVLEQDSANGDYHTYDCLLKEFAACAKGSIRSGEDWAGRYGGRIFLIVLSNTDYPSAVKIAQRIKYSFTQNAAAADKEVSAFTAHFGVKTLSDRINDADTFIRSAFISIGTNTVD